MGYRLGTMLDGSFRPLEGVDVRLPTGRIKLGTESNGGFKNIIINDCTFESCRGFALESVDGGVIEDIIFSDITMRDIRNAPLFLRLGARLRGPKDITVGTLKRVIVRGIPEEGGSGHNLFPADVPVREPRSRVADAERPHSSGIPALRL
jgi:hypothetical protein